MIRLVPLRFLAMSAAAALVGPLTAQTPPLAPWSTTVTKTFSTSEGACTADFADADADGDPDGLLYLQTKIAYCENTDGDATYSVTEHTISDPDVELYDAPEDGCAFVDDDGDGDQDDCVVAGSRTDTGECSVGRWIDCDTPTPVQRWVTVTGAYNPTRVAGFNGLVLVSTLGDFLVGGGGGLRLIRADDTVEQVTPHDEKVRDFDIVNNGALLIVLVEDHFGGVRNEYYVNDGSDNFSKSGEFTSSATGETAASLSVREENGNLEYTWFRYHFFPSPAATVEYARRVSGDGSQPSHWFYGSFPLGGSIPTRVTAKDNERLSIATSAFNYRSVVDVTVMDAQSPALQVLADVALTTNTTSLVPTRFDSATLVSPNPCTFRLVRGAYSSSRARGSYDCCTLGATGVHAISPTERRSHRTDFGPASSSLRLDTANPLIAGQRGAIRVRGGPAFGIAVVVFAADVAPSPLTLTPANDCHWNANPALPTCYIPLRLDVNGERDFSVNVPLSAAGTFVDTQAIGLGGAAICLGIYDLTNSVRDLIGNG